MIKKILRIIQSYKDIKQEHRKIDSYLKDYGDDVPTRVLKGNYKDKNAWIEENEYKRMVQGRPFYKDFTCSNSYMCDQSHKCQLPLNDFENSRIGHVNYIPPIGVPWTNCPFFNEREKEAT